jgi:TonB family protein
MNALINYLIETSLGLLFFYTLYWLFLRKETHFHFNRMYVLGSLTASLLVPLIHITWQQPVAVPSLSDYIPTYWLPEVIVGNSTTETQKALDVWMIIYSIYGIVSSLVLIRLLIQLTSLFRFINKTSIQQVQKKYILDLPEGKPTFSFFHYIFISKSSYFAEQEREQIIRHESVHAERMHSLDLLLIHVISIFFWFHPVLYFYKKILIQLHEFEADSRAVTDQEVDQYCGLLAKVALHSAEFPIANHFTNSLILKRITMMKTIKKNISPLKQGLMVLLAFVFFAVIACQDQVMHDLQEVTKTSTITTDYPAEVQEAVTKIKEVNMLAEVVVVGVIEGDNSTLEDIREQINMINISYVNIIKPKQKTGDYDMYLVLGDQLAQIADATATDSEVFTVVEETAMPDGGVKVFYEFLAKNLLYPESARNAGIEGKVFIQFVINLDGSLSDFVIMRGIGSGCDEEAIRVLQLSPPWIPGKQNGKVVKQRMILPITFALDDN